MKPLLFVILAFVSFSSFANEFCGLVSKIYVGYSINPPYSNTVSSAYVGSNKLKNLSQNELSILLAAKTNNLEVCVNQSSNPSSFSSSRSIELK